MDWNREKEDQISFPSFRRAQSTTPACSPLPECHGTWAYSVNDKASRSAQLAIREPEQRTSTRGVSQSSAMVIYLELPVASSGMFGFSDDGPLAACCRCSETKTVASGLNPMNAAVDSAVRNISLKHKRISTATSVV